MSADLFYVKLADGDVHRVSLDQLDDAFQAGHIDGGTMVLADGSDKWTTLGALAGMGMILQGAGLEKSALEIFKKALGIYPLEPNVRKLVEKLTLEIEGQDI